MKVRLLNAIVHHIRLLLVNDGIKLTAYHEEYKKYAITFNNIQMLSLKPMKSLNKKISTRVKLVESSFIENKLNDALESLENEYLAQSYRYKITQRRRDYQFETASIL